MASRDGPAMNVIAVKAPNARMKGIQLHEGPKTQNTPQAINKGANRHPGIAILARLS
jgi:hypothetical protein